MSSTTKDTVPPPLPPPRPEKVSLSPADDSTYDSTSEIDGDGDTAMGTTVSTGAPHAPRHTRSRPLPSGRHTHEDQVDVHAERRQTVRRLRKDLDIERAKSRSLAEKLEVAEETLKLTTKNLESADADREDFRRRWKQSTKELRQLTRPRHIVSQITDDDLTKWAKQLRLEIRDFSIRHFEADPHLRVDLHRAIGECQRAKYYYMMEDTTPGTTCFKAFLSSPTRCSIVIQSFVWHLLRSQVFYAFRWAGEVSAAANSVNTHFNKELIMSATQTDPEAMKRFKLWSVSTTGLLIDCGAREGRKHAFKAANDTMLKFLVKEADNVISAFLRPDADEGAYLRELEKIITRAITMDRDIFGQAADVTWEFRDSKGAALFDEATMTLEIGEKVPEPGADVVLVIAPAMYKLGRSNGDDFDKPRRLLCCSRDLEDIASKLQSLEISPTERRTGKLWKRLKGTIGVKDLQRMGASIHGHVVMLNIHLELSQAASMSASQAQQSEIVGLLKGIQSQMSMLCEKAEPGPSSPDSGPATSKPSIPGGDSPPDESIACLVELVAKMEGTVASDDAQQMIHNLEQLLRSTEKVELEALARAPPSCEGGCSEDISQELRIIRGLLASAPSLRINTAAASYALPLVEPGTVVQQRRKRKAIDTSTGALTVHTNKRVRTRPPLHGTQEGQSDEVDRRDFVAKILFRPKGSSSVLTMSVSQAQLVAGSFSNIPNLSVSNIIPRDSAVFMLAQEGKTDEILALIESGKANLRDHDELGWSLLHHGHKYPDLCEFLVQHGLDVDEVALISRSRFAGQITPLHECFRSGAVETTYILLRGGADPTIKVDGWPNVATLVSSEESSEAYKMLQHIMANALHFIDRDSRDYFGRTYFLEACNQDTDEVDSFEPQLHIHKLASLLGRFGAIDDRTAMGFTCLHVYFSDALGAIGSRGVKWHDSLVYLVQQGADVYAKDNRDLSVSEFAYRPRCVDNGRSSYPGDLWDAVLDACDYDIREFRKGFPRRARYTPVYTRGDFEALWKGREGRCPYWDDTDWFSPYDTPCERDLYDNNTEVVCHCDGHCTYCPCNQIDDTDEATDTDSICLCDHIDDTDEAIDTDLIETSGEQEGDADGEPHVTSPVRSSTSESTFENLVHVKHQEDQHGSHYSASSHLAYTIADDPRRWPSAPSALTNILTSFQYQDLVSNPRLDHGSRRVEELEDEEMELR